MRRRVTLWGAGAIVLFVAVTVEALGRITLSANAPREVTLLLIGLVAGWGNAALTFAALRRPRAVQLTLGAVSVAAWAAAMLLTATLFLGLMLSWLLVWFRMCWGTVGTRAAEPSSPPGR